MLMLTSTRENREPAPAPRQACDDSDPIARRRLCPIDMERCSCVRYAVDPTQRHLVKCDQIGRALSRWW